MAIPRPARPRLDVLGVFCLTALFLYVFVRVLWRVGDEGTVLYGASRVSEGAVPYRDFFEVMGPLTFYWLGFWFKLFGASWAVARTLLLLTGATTACLVYWITTRAYGRDSGMLSAFFCAVLTVPFWPASNHHWDSNLFFLAALAAAVTWQKNRRFASLAVAGVAAGITAGFMLQKGVLVLAVVLATVAWQNRRERRPLRESLVAALAVTGGFAAVLTAVVAWFYSAGALWDLWYATVVWPWTKYSTVNRVPYAYGLSDWMWGNWLTVLDSLLPHPAALVVDSILCVPLFALAALPLLAAGTLVRNWLRRHASVTPMAATLWFGGAALWVSEAHRWDIVHLMYGSSVLLAAVVGEALTSGEQKARKWRECLVLAVVFCTVILGAWNTASASAASTTQVTRRGDVRTFRVDEALQFLNAETRAGEWLFVYPYYPTYYFLAGVNNPTRYSFLVYGYNTGDQFRDAVDSLELRRPRYVLWDTFANGEQLKRWFPSYVQPPARDLAIEAYLAGHYESVGTKNGFRVLRRKAENDRRATGAH